MTDSLVSDTQPQTSMTDHDKPDQAPGPDKLVPVSEAIRYRKRAQTAEQQLEEINNEINAMQAKLTEASQTIVGLERRQKVDALLTEADAIDLETARLLTEQAVALMDEPEVELAVDDLKRHKPYLFRHKQAIGVSAMAPNIDHQGHDPAELAAEQATKTGDRRDLLRYLRLRRQH
jgi:hypothetical protein